MIYKNIYHLYVLYFLIDLNKHPPIQAPENESGDFNNLAPTIFLIFSFRMKCSITMFEFEIH